MVIVLGIVGGILFAGLSLLMHFGSTTTIVCSVAGVFAGAHTAVAQLREPDDSDDHPPWSQDSPECRQKDQPKK